MDFAFFLFFPFPFLFYSFLSFNSTSCMLSNTNNFPFNFKMDLRLVISLQVLLTFFLQHFLQDDFQNPLMNLGTIDFPFVRRQKSFVLYKRELCHTCPAECLFDDRLVRPPTLSLEKFDHYVSVIPLGQASRSIHCVAHGCRWIQYS